MKGDTRVGVSVEKWLNSLQSCYHKGQDESSSRRRGDLDAENCGEAVFV
jgi:hypothetical protein